LFHDACSVTGETDGVGTPLRALRCLFDERLGRTDRGKSLLLGEREQLFILARLGTAVMVQFFDGTGEDNARSVVLQDQFGVKPVDPELRVTHLEIRPRLSDDIADVLPAAGKDARSNGYSDGLWLAKHTFGNT